MRCDELDTKKQTPSKGREANQSLLGTALIFYPIPQEAFKKNYIHLFKSFMQEHNLHEFLIMIASTWCPLLSLVKWF